MFAYQKNFLHRKKNSSGFSLIELLVVVSIVGILAAIALPSYSNHILKSRRIDAKNALLDFAAREEKFFAINNRYSNDGTALGYGRALPIQINTGGQTYYTLSVVVPTNASGFTATATPTGKQTSDVCYAYVVDHLGSESNINSDATVITGHDCW